MRGGLDDALDKLARRDELRRRAAGEAIGTPPAVAELVEAIAAVVGRNPALGVTVGVEGAGDPLLLHFYFADGLVQVNADNAVNAQVPDAQAPPRHADFDLDLDEQAEEPYSAPPARPYQPPPGEGPTQRLSNDDQDRYGPATFGYAEQGRSGARSGVYYGGEPATAERRYGSFDGPPSTPEIRFPTGGHGETPRDPAAWDVPPPAQPAYPPHPFAATPPPVVPPQTRRIRPEQYQAPEEPSAADRIPQRPPAPAQRGRPTPLPRPIPLQVERPEETEMAARRLAALLRDDPSLLNQEAPD